MANFEKIREVLQPLVERVAVVGHEIATTKERAIGGVALLAATASLFAFAARSEAATTSNTVDVENPIELCQDNALAEPLSYGLNRVVKNHRSDQFVRPFVNLDSVEAEDQSCEDLGVTRVARVYEIKGGERDTPVLKVTGNEKGFFSKVFRRKTAYKCGQVIQGVVNVEADTDGQPGNDPSMTYRTNKAKIACP